MVPEITILTEGRIVRVVSKQDAEGHGSAARGASFDVFIWHGQSIWVCVGRGRQGYISKAVFFMYPYVFVAGSNQDDALLIIACAEGMRNLTIFSLDRNSCT